MKTDVRLVSGTYGAFRLSITELILQVLHHLAWIFNGISFVVTKKADTLLY
jgi:hypothetical protein